MTFRRITARTKITVPCVFFDAKNGDGELIVSPRTAQQLVKFSTDGGHPIYTHWMPFKWPGSGR